MTRWLTLAAALLGAVAHAGDLQGTVVDPAGQPVAGAIVAATAAQPERAADGRPRRNFARSDAHGRFRLADLTVGSYAATATLAGLGAAGPIEINVPAQGVAAPANLALRREPARLEGRLRFAAAGVSVSDAMIAVGRLDGDRVAAVFIGEVHDGRFALNLPAGPYVVKAIASGRESETSMTRLVAPRTTVLLAIFDPLGSEPALAVELIAMGEAEQAVRQRSIDAGNDNQAVLREMAEIDTRNQKRLKQIIAARGWPRASLVGLDAAKAAWLIAQHDPADLLPANLAAMQAAADDGEMPLADLALSIDRVLVTQGKPQRYGSQGKVDANGAMGLEPIEDEANVDARREGVGLGPLAEYRRVLEETYRPRPASAPRP